MTTKTVCNKCGNEKIRNISSPAASMHVRSSTAEPNPTWLNLRVSLSPSYLTQITLDICPSCCEELGLPNDGIRPIPTAEAAVISALADYVTETVELEIQNYHD